MRRMYSLEQLKNVADERVKALVESGALENAKPLYWHGLTLESKAKGGTFGGYYTLCLVIINNSAESINTWAKLKQIIINLGDTATIQTNGFYNYNNDGISNVAFLYYYNGSLYIVGNDYQCSRFITSDSIDNYDAIFSEEGAVITDKCNKLN